MAKNKKRRQPAAEWLTRTLRVHGKRIEVEVPTGRGAQAALERACEEAERRIENEQTGARVRGANPQGRPSKVFDDDLVTAWCRWRDANRAWTVDEVSRSVQRGGIALSVDRITKRVRAFLQQRGDWNKGAGPS